MGFLGMFQLPLDEPASCSDPSPTGCSCGLCKFRGWASLTPGFGPQAFLRLYFSIIYNQSLFLFIFGKVVQGGLCLFLPWKKSSEDAVHRGEETRDRRDEFYK